MLRGRAARARANRKENDPDLRSGGLFTLEGGHGNVKTQAAGDLLGENNDGKTANSQMSEGSEHEKEMRRDHGKVAAFLEQADAEWKDGAHSNLMSDFGEKTR